MPKYKVHTLPIAYLLVVEKVSVFVKTNIEGTGCPEEYRQFESAGRLGSNPSGLRFVKLLKVRLIRAGTGLTYSQDGRFETSCGSARWKYVRGAN